MEMRATLARCIALMVAVALVGATAAYAHTHALTHTLSPMTMPVMPPVMSGHHHHDGHHSGQHEGRHHHDHAAHAGGDCVGCLGFADIGSDPVATPAPVRFSTVTRYATTAHGTAGPTLEPDPDPPRLSA